MDLPSVGARIRSGSMATVLAVEPPNAAGNVRCLVEDAQGRLGWIMYYAGGQRSNINYFPRERVEGLRAQLNDGQRRDSGEEAE